MYLKYGTKGTIVTELFVADEKKTWQLCLSAGYCDMPGAYYQTSLSSGEDILTDDPTRDIFIPLYRCHGILSVCPLTEITKPIRSNVCKLSTGLGCSERILRIVASDEINK